MHGFARDEENLVRAADSGALAVSPLDQLASICWRSAYPALGSFRLSWLASSLLERLDSSRSPCSKATNLCILVGKPEHGLHKGEPG